MKLRTSRRSTGGATVQEPVNGEADYIVAEGARVELTPSWVPRTIVPVPIGPIGADTCHG